MSYILNIDKKENGDKKEYLKTKLHELGLPLSNLSKNQKRHYGGRSRQTAAGHRQHPRAALYPARYDPAGSVRPGTDR